MNPKPFYATKTRLLATYLFILAALFAAPIHAEENTPDADNAWDWLTWHDYESRNQLWINPGMASYHFQTEKGYNNGNWGYGAEYRFANVASLVRTE